MLITIDLNDFVTISSILSIVLPYINLSIIVAAFARNEYLKYRYIQSLKNIPFNITECEQKDYAIAYLQQFEKLNKIYNSNSALVLHILDDANLLIYKYETGSYSDSYLYTKLCDFHNYIINYDITSKYAYNDDYKKVKDIDKFGIIFCNIIISIFVFILLFYMYFMFFI